MDFGGSQFRQIWRFWSATNRKSGFRVSGSLQIAEISEGIEPEVSLSRYPGIIGDSLWLPFEEYERGDAEKTLEKAGGVMSTADDFISYWFPLK